MERELRVAWPDGQRLEPFQVKNLNLAALVGQVGPQTLDPIVISRQDLRARVIVIVSPPPVLMERNYAHKRCFVDGGW
jgi:hypothetical protein